MSDAEEPHWKLELRYGRLETPYEHFVVLADVRVMEPDMDLGTRVGPAWLAVKVWAADSDAAMDLVEAVVPELGAELQGRIEVYEREPDEPPRAAPFVCGPSFVAYSED